MIGRLFAVVVVATIVAVQSFTLVDVYGDRLKPVRYHDGRGREIFHRLFWYDPSWSAVDAALEWVARDAAPDDVIATTVPHLAYIRTGLKAVLPPFEPDTGLAQVLLASVPVRYVILDDLPFLDISRRYAEPVIRAHPERWDLVYSAPDAGLSVYRRAD
jgi:hypothetical protein